ncbi:MAG: PDZ domain-containing protein [Calditrichaeota bacterium]|nr:PDZ domain-containing protein [Calditrichota bacterium]
MRLSRLFYRFIYGTIIFSTVLSAQVVTRQFRTSDDGEIFQLPELAAIVVADSGKVRFLAVMDSEHRPAAYADIDAQEQDEILMINGQRIKTVENLKSRYDALEIGAEIKLGLRRDGQMFLISFPKIDPEDAPRQVVRTVVGDGSGNTDSIYPMPGLQILLRASEDKILVEKLHGLKEAPPAGTNFQDGDILRKLDGKAMASVNDFRTLYESYPPGQKVTIEVNRNGQPVTSSFAKPASPGRVMMMRK